MSKRSSDVRQFSLPLDIFNFLEQEEDSSSDYDSWISWFCNQKGCEFFCEVDEEYIESNFNLFGLKEQVRHYQKSLDVILDVENQEIENASPELLREIHEDAEKLYGLVHARYILTRQGQERMKQLYLDGFFGRCPRVNCGCKVLPIGESDVSGRHHVKVYCPRCCDMYHARSSRYKKIDGAYFGTTFPHLFFMVHPKLLPRKKKVNDYVPRIFGFRIKEMSNEEEGESEEE